MAVSTPVPALYEPGAPPPTLPLLTSQTDIFYNPLHSCTITAREELPPGQQTRCHQSLPPTPNLAGRVRFQSLPAHSNDDVSEDSDSSLTSLSSSDSDSESDSDELNEEDNKIGKPPGEAGRPGRGGYNLRVALGWAADDHKKLLVCIFITHFVSHNANVDIDLQDFVDWKVDKCLDYKQSYMSQKPSSLGLVNQAVRDFLSLIGVISE